MGVLIAVGQLMLSLSILIVLHEGGHFLPARWFNVRVEKFYLFFDPWFSLLKTKKGDTEYGVGWLPLGGYVKLSGMVDESLDTAQLNEPPKPWEFRSKPAWQRLIIMLGGVTVNLILGFFIYGMVLWTWGEEYLPNENVTYGVVPDSLGRAMGIEEGDHIASIGGKPFEKFSAATVIREVIVNDARSLTVRRDKEEIQLPIGEDYARLLSSRDRRYTLFDMRLPFDVREVLEGSPAEQAGVRPGDQILQLNGKPARFFHEFQKEAQQHKGKEVTLTLLREQDTLRLSMTTTEKGMVGLAPKMYETRRQDYTLAQALPAGVSQGWGLLADQVKAFGQMFRGRINPSDSLGGFVTIGQMYGTVWDWERFWKMTAILSLILAFMNLLPIPALDGGHVMFLLYEVATGRKPSDKFLEYATLAGFIIVLGLVIYVNGLDIKRLLDGLF